MVDVSVIIPFYKNIFWLEEAIDSILNQTHNSVEIIVINDGSLEDDREFLLKYDSHIQYRKIKNGGPGAARNVGIDIAGGKYIAFLDSDDIWLPGKLEQQVKLMNETGAIWSHTNYSTFNENDKKRALTLIDVSNYFGNIFPKCIIRLQIATPCVMIKTQYLKNNSFIRFSEKMRYGQDGYMWMLMGAKNKLYVCDESLANVRRTGDNAVLRTRVHLKMRADLYINLITRFHEFYPELNINYFIVLAYKYCYYSNRFLERLEKIASKKTAENISKALYLPVYAYIKLLYNFF